jgi:tripartite-type tricarboxylate transporter receptor subunit TctC
LLAGDVDLMFDNLGVSLPLVEAGKLKLLAVRIGHPHAELAERADNCRTAPRFRKRSPGTE